MVSKVELGYKGNNGISTFYVFYRVKPVQKASNWWLAGTGVRDGEWIIQGNQHRLYIVDGYYVLSHAFNG